MPKRIKIYINAKCTKLTESTKKDKEGGIPGENLKFTGQGLGELKEEYTNLNFIKNITNTDLQSLGEGKWITTTIIANNLNTQHEINMTKNVVL